MSSEQILTTGDFRSTAQDYKRDAARKAKWALGPIERAGNDPNRPRPFRPSETAYNFKRRETKGAIASSSHACKSAHREDIDINDATDVLRDEIVSPIDRARIADFPPASPTDATIMYSFDAAHGPTHGSQILNVALSKAVDQYEEKETTKLVKNEYDMIDSTGESVNVASGRKSTAKSKAPVGVAKEEDLDEEYEFV